MSTLKRKANDIPASDSERLKRARVESDETRTLTAAPLQAAKTAVDSGKNQNKNMAPAVKRRKLAPPRPYPTVPASVNATGPRSTHHEGKNYIAVTRKTKLAAYLRRCKDLVIKDGYKSLHLNALGAAIPHLTLLATSLPSVLPYPPDELRMDILTGTVTVQDEIIPDDEDEDIGYEKREKSTLSVVLTIGDGVDEPVAGGANWGPRGKRRRKGLAQQSKISDNAARAGEAVMDTT
ncbi:unnamed protein product [Peniophora sp. CBMAI 1063]|nr:unnamed protein product [Peniophora sp. CBMAI 1063]